MRFIEADKLGVQLANAKQHCAHPSCTLSSFLIVPISNCFGGGFGGPGDVFGGLGDGFVEPVLQSAVALPLLLPVLKPPPGQTKTPPGPPKQSPDQNHHQDHQNHH